MILDDGGDTLHIILGAELENGKDVLSSPSNEEEEAFKKQLMIRFKSTPGWFTKVKNSIKGVSEETTTGVLRLYQMAEKGNYLSQLLT